MISTKYHGVKRGRGCWKHESSDRIGYAALRSPNLPTLNRKGLIYFATMTGFLLADGEQKWATIRRQVLTRASQRSTKMHARLIAQHVVLLP
jgi:hypothetical protein